jgi:hypothetical protein
MQSTHHLASLSNDELVASLQRLVHDEHQLVAVLIEHLLEVEERRIRLEMAVPSMYAYCRDGLGWSEGQTHRRLTAARLVKRIPSLLDAIREGRIHLSNLALLRDRFILYSELDDNRFEVRKVEVFRNRTCGYASAEGAFGGTQLGLLAMPELSEIAKDPQFEPVEIAQAEFETVWARREAP